MRSPSTGSSIAALITVVSVIAQAAHARRPDPGSIEADDELFRRQYARDENNAVRASVRRWTWAAMAPKSYDDDDDWGQYRGEEPSRLARVTALATDASGAAIVGGVVRGPIQLGATAVGQTESKRGFIARVDRGGGFRMIRLEQWWMWPTALALDRTGKIIVSYEDRKLAAMTPQGRTIWSRDLPTARALAVAPDGDILAAGCKWDERRVTSPHAMIWVSETVLGDGYVARISPGGNVRWMYRMELGQGDLFYRANDRHVADCATAIAPGPGGDIYVAGSFSRDVPEGRADEPNLPVGGSFLARFSGDGQLRWSRLVAGAFGRVWLAAAPDGAVVVVAGNVAPPAKPDALPDPGLAAFDADGMPLWSLPLRKPPQPAAAAPDVGNLQVVAHKAGDTDFVVAGTYHAALAAGDASLAWTDGGVFLLKTDRRGAVKSLRGLRAQREQTGEGSQASAVVLGPAAAGLWVGGIMGARGRGAWLQMARW